MASNMETYLKYKVPLQDFQYPNIYALKDDEIQELFMPKNWCLLLTWLVNSLNSEVTFEKDSTKGNETLIAEVIADYLYETGFCSSSQKMSFVQRTCSMEVDIQIFDRIFNYLYQIQDEVSMDSFESNSQKVSINDLLSKDVNLIPSSQTLKVFSEEEREHELRKRMEHIKHLKEIIDDNPNVNDKFNIEDYTFEDSVCNSNIEKFKEHIKNLTRSTSIIKQKPETEISIGFNETFPSHLANCCNQIMSVMQYFNNNKMMKSAKEKVNSQVFDEEVIENVKNCTDNFDEVVKLLKEG
ncbi:hypothetical protein FQR65_LT10436 [Abscondita terminalis]|nr:hypothetical protein FQR65_LT10436 [Abscondita terminalis]